MTPNWGEQSDPSVDLRRAGGMVWVASCCPFNLNCFMARDSVSCNAPLYKLWVWQDFQNTWNELTPSPLIKRQMESAGPFWKPKLKCHSFSLHICSFFFFPMIFTGFGCSCEASSLACRLWEQLGIFWKSHWKDFCGTGNRVRWHSDVLIQTVNQPSWFLNLLLFSLFVFRPLQQVEQEVLWTSSFSAL